jgi:hypothetical protein
VTVAPPFTTVNVTGIVIGGPVEGDNSTIPEYGPAVNPVVFAVMVRVAGCDAFTLIEPGETVSHDWPACAVNEVGDVLVAVTVTPCEVICPAVAPRVTALGVTEIVNVTVT